MSLEAMMIIIHLDTEDAAVLFADADATAVLVLDAAARQYQGKNNNIFKRTNMRQYALGRKSGEDRRRVRDCIGQLQNKITFRNYQC